MNPAKSASSSVKSTSDVAAAIRESYDSVKIISDTREREINTLLPKTTINYSIAQLSIGDFVLAFKGCIIAVVERKTWADLAASIGDGRSENHQKLLKARAETGSAVFYLMEGPRPARNYVFRGGRWRMPMKNVLSHLRHLQADPECFIGVLYSTDVNDTLAELQDLARSLLNMSTIPGLRNDNVTDTTITGAATLLTRTQLRTQHDEMDLLNGVKGITIEAARVTHDNGIRLSDLYRFLATGAFNQASSETSEQLALSPWDQLLNLRHPDGRQVTRQREALRRNILALGGKSQASKRAQFKCLSSLVGVSEKSAKAVLGDISLGELFLHPDKFDPEEKEKIKSGPVRKRVAKVLS